MTRLYRFLCWILLAAAVFSTGACSVIDGGDEDMFVLLLEKLPAEDRHRLKARTRADEITRDLRSRDPQSRAIRTECRFREGPDAEWEDWKTNVTHDITAQQLLDCFTHGASYEDCLTIGIATLLIEAKKTMDMMPMTGGEIECRAQIEPDFEPSTVDGADKTDDEITWEDVIKWLLRQPVPPVGFSATTWESLAPILCGLGQGWGCPGSPDYPGIDGTIEPAPSSGSGGDP